jgi:GT2 family glycosyltransferase
MRVISPHATVLRETSNPLDHEAIDRLLLQGFGGLAHPTAMIRRTALDRVAGYRSEFDYADDLDLILRLSEVGRLANLPETVIKYRLHIDSICHTKAELQRQRTLEFVREAHRRRGLEPPQDVAGSQLKVRSRLEWHYRFGRMAIRDGRFWSAWSHVLRSLCLAPTKPHSWKMLLSAMLRREI